MKWVAFEIDVRLVMGEHNTDGPGGRESSK